MKLIQGDGLKWLNDNPQGFVLTDAPKHLIRQTIEVCERHRLQLLNYYAILVPNQSHGEKTVEPYRRILAVIPETLIIDPFMGSGTIGIACLLTGKDYIGIELDPERFAYAQSRLENALAGSDTGNLREVSCTGLETYPL